jgi:hypothetical protein
MTMQVTMIGQNGIILASDTKWATNVFNPRHDELREEHNRSKILISRSETMAVARAHDMIRADEVAKKIISDWNPETDNPNLGNVVAPFVGRHQFECLIAYLGSTPGVARITYPKDHPDPPIVTTASDRLCAGDIANPAKFWHLRYYSRTRSVDELMGLAAQLIADASSLNSGSIGGLEIVFSDHGTFKRLSEPRCRELESEALDRSEKIKEIIFPVP